MRIRKPFAAAFAALVLVAGYLGLGKLDISRYSPYAQSDKGLHLVTFFLLTIAFYWIFDTTRRRVLHITLVVCTVVLACGSEIVQGILPNDRNFDYLDIVANILGSLAAVGLCAWYHRRMLERKRASKTYQSVPGDEETGGGGDVELDDNIGEQETGVTTAGQTEATIDEELDNWDENAEDPWDEEEPSQANGDSKADANAPASHAQAPAVEDDVGRKKRDD